MSNETTPQLLSDVAKELDITSQALVDWPQKLMSGESTERDYNGHVARLIFLTILVQQMADELIRIESGTPDTTNEEEI